MHYRRGICLADVSMCACGACIVDRQHSRRAVSSRRLLRTWSARTGLPAWPLGRVQEANASCLH
eukprot:9240856-Pyramimonas_sp.AAC.1